MNIGVHVSEWLAGIELVPPAVEARSLNHWTTREFPNFFFFFTFFLGAVPQANRISVPQPGIEPGPLAVETWSPNHWTARELN